MSQQIRSKSESTARRKARTIARHIGHISSDASPVVLAELHGNLGRAIAEIATTARQEKTNEHH